MFLLQKLIILLCCTYYSFASEHSHTIPVEHYETELQDLGEHVETPKTPVKVVKITKTIAVKIPVPYPVKVIERVPYPVHVSKPYPVPVPHIVHVPHPSKPKSLSGHDSIDAGHEGQQQSSIQDHEKHEDYQVHESPSHDTSDGGHSFSGFTGLGQHFRVQDGDPSSENGSYDGPNNYYGYSGDNDGHGSVESKSYDQAINEYLKKHKRGGSFLPHH